MASWLIISSLIMCIIVMTAMAKCKAPKLISNINDTDSFLYTCEDLEVPTMEEAERLCKLVGENIHEIADQMKIMGVDVDKSTFEWHVPEPDTEEKNQWLADALVGIDGSTRLACWIGLKRQAPTTNEEKEGAGWKNPSKWSWPNFVKTTLELFKNPPWEKRSFVEQPDNDEYVRSKNEDDHERCVVAGLVGSGKVVWIDQHCDGKGPTRLKKSIRLVCQILRKAKSKDPTTTTSEAGVTTTGSDMSLITIILAVGLFAVIITTIVCVVRHRRKKNEDVPSESTDYSSRAICSCALTKRRCHPSSWDSSHGCSDERATSGASPISQLQGVQPKLHLEEVRSNLRQEADEAKCLIIVEEDVV